MANATFRNVEIKGIASCVPRNEISIYDEAEYYANNLKKIERMRKMSGFNKRRVLADKRTTPSDMALFAANKLIEGMNLNAGEIDALIYVAQNPDFVQPATSFYIHKQLNLPESCLAFDITHGCPGWVYGLHNAHCLIQSGAAKKVLLLTADTPSTKIDIEDRQTAPIFGDAASATLLEWTDKETLSYFELGADGSGYDAIITPAGGARFPIEFDRQTSEPTPQTKKLLEKIETPSPYKPDLTKKYMNGLEVFNFTVAKVPKYIKHLLEYSGFSAENTDRLFLHQANSQIVGTVRDAVDFPAEKCSSQTFEEYGNQTVSSIPVSICHIFSEEASQKENRIVCAGFGIGLAWGICALNLGKIYCEKVFDFDEPQNFALEKTAEYWQKKYSTK